MCRKNCARGLTLTTGSNYCCIDSAALAVYSTWYTSYYFLVFCDLICVFFVGFCKAWKSRGATAGGGLPPPAPYTIAPPPSCHRDHTQHTHFCSFPLGAAKVEFIALQHNNTTQHHQHHVLLLHTYGLRCCGTERAGIARVKREKGRLMMQKSEDKAG